MTQLAHPFVLRAVGTIRPEDLIERGLEDLLELTPLPIDRIPKMGPGMEVVHDLTHGPSVFIAGRL